MLDELSAANAALAISVNINRTDFMAAFVPIVPSLVDALRIVLLASALTLVAPSAFPAPPASREEALAQLSAADAAARMEAIVWFANHGSMADTPLLEQRLRDENGYVRAYAERGLWAIWSRSGDPEVDALMARGVQQMEEGDHKAAIATFSQVVKRKPDFAEGWNKRATVYYLAGEFKRSIADCAQVLQRNPRHFGALSGLGQIYYRLDDWEKSIEWYRKALEVNPNMGGVELNLKALESMQRERKGKSI
jgi:tetratricopeptide (TPR) repeat protein